MESCWDSTFPIILLYPNIKCLLQGCPLSISEHVMLLPNYGHVSVLPSVQHVFFLPRRPGRGSHPFCAKPTHASGPLHMLSTLPSTVFSRKPHHVCVSFFLESVPMSHPQRALSWQPCINSTPFTLSHTPHSTFLQSTYHSLPYYKFTCLNVKSLSLSLQELWVSFATVSPVPGAHRYLLNQWNREERSSPGSLQSCTPVSQYCLLWSPTSRGSNPSCHLREVCFKIQSPGFHPWRY